MNGKKLVFLLTIVALFLSGAVFAQAKRAPSNDMGLVDDIPEPPDASAELPSPIPMVVEYVGGLMAGDFDKCLQHFHVPTFLGLIFGDDVKVMQDADYRELYSYQIQAQRNEFRFMSKVMNRVAKGCKYAYSNPRYHQNVQSKVVVKMQTTKGPHEFVVFSRYVDERWQVYDYSLDGKRFTDSFRAGLNGMKPMDYTAMLRPFYGDQKKFKQVQNDDFGFSMKLPENFQIREKVSPTLLFTAQSFDNQFLMHVQAAVYPQAKGLKEVAAEIKQGLMQFNPRLYDQWRTDIAGVEIGNVVFRFDKNGKTLFTQMVIVPLGQKLVVLNFYHNSLPLMKNLSNIRDRILESLKLTKIELAAASDVTIPADDTSLPSNSPNELPPYQDNPPPPDDSSLTPPPPPPEGDEPPPPPPDDGDVPPPPPPDDNGDNPPPPPPDGGDGTEPPPPPPDGGDGTEPPPPPPDGGDGTEPPPPPPDGGDEPPPPPPDDGDSPSYRPPEDGGGNEVSF